MTPAVVRALASALILWSSISCALAASVEESFAAGVRAFETGDFASAREQFEQARAAGLDTPALHYNLGATLYRLGRYAEAGTAFETCLRDPAWAPLAHYNLGLVALQQGQNAIAAGHFAQAWRYAEDRKLAALAQTMLVRLDPLAWWTPRGRLSLSLGHDSNVLLTDQAQTTTATGKSDGCTEFQASTGARLGSRPRSPRWEAAIYDLRYFELSDYSLTSLQLGLGVPWSVGDWSAEAGVQWQYLLRDGGDYQRIAALRAQALRGLAGQRSLRLDLRYESIESIDNDFRFLDGTRVVVGVSVAEPAGNGSLYYGALLERNDRADLAAGGEFYSYSPTRAGLWAGGSWPLAARWRLEPTLRYRYGRYADAEQRTGGLVETRSEYDWQIGVGIRYRLSLAWQVTGEYLYSGNRSNFDEYSYTRHQLQVGLSRSL